jgi:SagB-type dehydrogenase family enzyme
MERRKVMKKLIIACSILGLFLFINPFYSSAQDANVIKLPPPQMDGGKPLMQALKLRQSTRGDFGPEKKLSLQTLSDLLWAADGVNRPDAKQPEKGHRTAPSAVDWQNIQIYVATADGLFLYDAPQHILKVISKQDVRTISGLEGPAAGPMKQDFAKTAPVSLVYVADMTKAKGMKWNGEDAGVTWSFVNAGAIAENVYLFCASKGLACILRAMVDGAKITEVFKLSPDQKVLLTSTIGQFKTTAQPQPKINKSKVP